MVEIIIYAFLAVILLTFAWSAGSLAPWVPARKKDLSRIARLAGLREGERFCDLGCGDGRVAFYVARHTRGEGVGLELSLFFYLWCRVRLLFYRQKNLRFNFKSLFSEDLSGADAVYIFPASRDKLKGRLKRKLERELKPGSRVITYAFPVEGWQPEQVDKPGENDISVYLYLIE